MSTSSSYSPLQCNHPWLILASPSLMIYLPAWKFHGLRWDPSWCLKLTHLLSVDNNSKITIKLHKALKDQWIRHPWSTTHENEVCCNTLFWWPESRNALHACAQCAGYHVFSCGNQSVDSRASQFICCCFFFPSCLSLLTSMSCSSCQHIDWNFCQRAFELIDTTRNAAFSLWYYVEFGLP